MKITSLLSILVCCMLLPTGVFAQDRSPEGIIRCLTSQREAAYRQQFPEMESEADFEKWIESHKNRLTSSTRAVIRIPVIVHIVHNGEVAGGGSNISIAQVNSQIDILNEDFRRKTGTPGFNTHPDGADTGIEFCLAAVDPSGIPLLEQGIHRVNRNNEGFAAPPYLENYVDNTIKPVTSWDPTRYMNFWVCDLDNDILGFAKWPTSSTLPGIGGPFPSASIDGVVIRSKSFGNTGNVVAPYNKGRRATHEVGHFFGLRHIWGDGGCGVDDYCADTPESDAGNFGCPVGHISCGSSDMTANYMDYTDDVCMNTFTEDQKTRMMTVLANSPRRMELANSNVCTIQMIPPAANFTSDITTGCPGISIRFSDASTNGPISWNWAFPGGAPGSSILQNPIITYAAAGTYAVTLEATNAFGNHTTQKSGFITVDAAGLQVIYHENFENGVGDWTTSNPDNGKTWELVSGISGSKNGNSAVRVELYLYETIGERDGLISPVFDLSNKSSVKLEFEHAYRSYTGSPPDSLLIYVSTDGGNTFPNRVFAQGESGSRNFITNSDITSAFVPSSDLDWCYDGNYADCYSVDLSDFDGENNVVINFETHNGYGNNLYIDNISLLGACSGVISISPPKSPIDLVIYPNPNDGEFSLQLNGEIPKGEINIRVLDLLGHAVFSRIIQQTSQQLTEHFSLTSVSPGTYIVEVKAGENSSYKKVVITR